MSGGPSDLLKLKVHACKRGKKEADLSGRKGGDVFYFPYVAKTWKCWGRFA